MCIRDRYIIDMTIKDGSTSEKTYETAVKIGDILDKEDSVEDFAFKAGDGFMKYYTTFVPTTQSSNKAQFLVNGKQSEIEKIQKKIEENVPGVIVNIKKLEIGIPVDYPIEVRISGDDIDVLRKASEDIKARLYKIEGTQNVEDNYGYDSYKLNIQVNEEKANMVGITNYDISKTVRMVVNGLQISELKTENVEDDSLPMIMRISDAEKSSRDILDKVYVTSQATGKNVPLSEIATINTKTSLNKIVRKKKKKKKKKKNKNHLKQQINTNKRER
eukprot:TRINITY_DN65011_c0_g1_i1.p1 TRINITY_DN65011_c0_g1~~TRINITY_DN65011_c0_g1_i1.p1  ORF type:complete len:274 (+),score=73.45 TRINITY_DN65011_c0_g1_i1:77-898(+)